MVENKQNAVTYDYMSLRVKSKNRMYLTDCFSAFGWELFGEQVKTLPDYCLNRKTRQFGHGSVYLEFRRNAKITDKAKLQYRQSEFEEKLQSIHKYTAIEKHNSRSGGIGTGLLGMGLFALSASFFLKEIYWAYAVCTALGVACCIGAYFKTRAIRKMLEKKYTPKIQKLIAEVNTLVADTKLMLEGE